MADARLRFGLLGRLEVTAGGRPVELLGTKPKALLVILLASANRVVPTDRLIDDLWSGAPTPGATATLQGYVSELRKALAEAAGAPAPILTRRPGYLISVEPDQVDLLQFERLIAQAQDRAGKSFDEIGAHLREALSLWRGPALEEFTDEPFARPVAARLEEARLWALQERVEIDLTSGCHGELVTELDDLIARHPMCERLWGQRMLALYRCGRQAEALRTYQDLRHLLGEELGIEPSPALQRLEGAILVQDLALELRQPAAAAVPPPPPAPAAAPEPPAEPIPTLPVPLTGFVGRKQELQTVRALLAGTRLLSLIGSGGSGKTRLALHLAAEERHRFAGGARFVDLSALSDPAGVPGAVGVALGLLGRGDLQSVCDRLADLELLLVLDNCEQVVDACAELVEAVLTRCPGVRVVVTSQEALQIGGETVWRVPSLGLPHPDPTADGRSILDAEAVQLFLQRASSAQPGFAPDEAALVDIARICRRLDGIPLAIELAAALVAILPVDDIVRRLDDRFALLTRGSRRSEPRQRTLKAAVDWSYELLGGSQREMFNALSVFVGSFTLDAAEAAAGPRAGFFDDFSALVSKSLVVTLAGAGRPQRYRLLETMRHYGLERLGESGQEAAVRHRHAAFYMAFAEAADEKLHGSNAADWSSHLVRELPNLRAALDWSFSSGQLETGVRLAGALKWWFFGRMGQLDQARAWLEAALERRDELSPALVLKTLTATMTVATSQGDYHLASKAGDEAVTLAEELDDRAELAFALLARGGAAVYEGNSTRALECLGRALSLCQDHGDRWGRAWVLTFWAIQSRHAGDHHAARAPLAEALATFRDLRDDHNQVIPLTQLALVAQEDGDLDEAVRHCQDALELARRLGDRQLAHGATCIYGRVELARGRRDEARRLLVTSLRSFREEENQLVVTFAVEGLAIIVGHEGRHEEAAQLWGFSGERRTAAQIPPTQQRLQERDHHLRLAAEQIGADRVERALATGSRLSFDQVLALVDPA